MQFKRRHLELGKKVEQAMIENRRMQYLYADGDNHVFMDNETFDQTELSADYLKDELKYLKANMEVQIQSYEGETIGVELPKTVELEVTETEPGIKVILPLEQLNQLQLKQVIL